MRGGVKHFCKGVALSSFLTAVLAGISFPSFAADSVSDDFTEIELLDDKNLDGTYTADERYDFSVFDTNDDGIFEINENIKINGANKDVYASTDEENLNTLYDIPLYVKDGVSLDINGVQGNSLNIKGNGDISITNLKENKEGTFHADGIYVEGNIEGHDLTIKTTVEGAKGINAYDTNTGNGIDGVTIDLTGDLKIYSDWDGVFATQDNKNDINIEAKSVYIESNNRTGVLNAGDATLDDTPGEQKNFINITAEKDITIISSHGTASGDTYAGVRNRNKGTTTLTSNSGNIIVNASDNYNGVYADVGAVNISAKSGRVEISGKKVAVNAKGIDGVSESTPITIEADEIELFAGEKTIVASNLRDSSSDFYNGLASSVENGAKEYFYSNINTLHGAAFASGTGSEILIAGDKEGASSSQLNAIYSSAVISEAGDLNEDKNPDSEHNFSNKDVVSALYAEEGASITLKGTQNIIRTYANSADYNKTLERVVWAYNGKDGKATTINIDGHTLISTDSYEENHNNADIAIAAGTAVNLDDTLVSNSKNMLKDDRAQVVLNYNDLVDTNGVVHSRIEGDILSAYEGYIEITPKAGSNAGIDIKGNLLAGNNGILSVNLGQGGSLTGRIDDYGDAGVGEVDDGHQGHQSLFNPAFSSAIYEGGRVDLTMGRNSSWDVTGQSWVTSISTNIFDSTTDDVSYLPTIDLTKATNENNPNAAGLTVYNFSGDSKFKMNLDGHNLNNSNMLYMKNANGNYYIELADAVSADEINTALHDGLRFATVGKDSHVTFYVGSINRGVFNVQYEVGQDYYDRTGDENKLYNGDALTAAKPGDSTVGDFFGSEGAPVGEDNTESENQAANAIMTLDETAAAEEEVQQNNSTGAINHKIIGISSTEVSDIGKTVVDLSRANYANAVYMDTLNKRQGEARFIGDTDHGVWVRLRHDNIGKEDSFRSHNTMVEVGIDQRDVHDYGEFHTGVALDYMNGSLDYHTVDGDGDIERYGVWFYTTFLGNDGQYADLILKYGHLKNDFGFNTRSQGEHVTGAYTNETASLSAEYGWKFSNSHNYYIEPQAQLQYTYVTGADYTTSQGTKVDLDSIHSLIGRVGIRAGKDFLDWEHPVSLYARADALHEFLGDQDIYAYDDTGVMDITYENDDTWYTVGLGLTVKSSENTYFFIEGETALGADNEDTYTFSGGFRHSF